MVETFHPFHFMGTSSQAPTSCAKVMEKWYENLLQDVQLPSTIDTRQAGFPGGCATSLLLTSPCTQGCLFMSGLMWN